jgi:SAM-dependent methyltransferase
MTESHVKASWLSPVIARLYDWYDEYTEDLEMWKRLAADEGSPILELGSGTARVLLALAQAGHEVTGVEISPAMIEVARRKIGAEPEAVQRRITLVQADMTDFDLQQRFAFGFIGCNTLCEVSTLEGQRRALSRFYSHLQPGGLAVVSVPNPILGRYPSGGPMSPEEAKPHLLWESVNPATGKLTRHISASWHDPVEQKRYIRFTFEEQETDGSWTRHETQPPGEWGQMRYLCRFELQLMLEQSGFEIENVWGGYDGEPLSTEGGLVFAARRTT